MRIIIKDRGKGKTTQMIYTSEATGIPIMVETHSQANHIKQLAEEMNVMIPDVIVESEGIMRGKRPDNVLIDEGYNIIEKALKAYLGSNVIALTMSDRIKEDYKIRGI